jgi:hypothetical protein
MEYPKLYKLNAHGKVLEWYLERDGNKYRTISGQQDGKQTTSNWTIAVGKNIGKKNATTGEDQADKECLAKYEKKLKGGGYVANIEEVVQFTYTKPMLADTYYSEKCDPETGETIITDNRPTDDVLKLGEYVLQPKLDGVRCLASKEGLYTRKGEKIIGVPHIAAGLEDFFQTNDITLDGELYIHSMDFNELSGTIRRDSENDTNEEAKVRRKIKYFVYDVISEDPYQDRLKVLNLLNSEKAFPEKVYVLSTQTPNSREEINNKHDDFVAQGYEGAILRNNKAPYQEGKRTRDLLKIKKFEDAEFIITNVLEGEGNHSGLATKVEIEDNGVKVYPSITGRAEFKQLVLQEKDQYIGGQVTVKFFGRTPDGSLRHPSVKAIYKGKRDM